MVGLLGVLQAQVKSTLGINCDAYFGHPVEQFWLATTLIALLDLGEIIDQIVGRFEDRVGSEEANPATQELRNLSRGRTADYHLSRLGERKLILEEAFCEGLEDLNVCSVGSFISEDHSVGMLHGQVDLIMLVLQPCNIGGQVEGCY